MEKSSTEYNEWEEYTDQELQEVLESSERRLQNLYSQPSNSYTVGHSDTYSSAMSQVWGVQSCKDTIREIKAEIEKRNSQQMQ